METNTANIWFPYTRSFEAMYGSIKKKFEEEKIRVRIEILSFLWWRNFNLKLQ